MNNALLHLYETHWDNFINKIYKPYLGKCSYPFLIKTTQHYENAAKRVMICGQETQGWGGEYPNPDSTKPDLLMSLYDGFVNQNNDGGKINKPGYNSPYWNFNWRLMQANPDVGFVFQNVVKVGKYSLAGCDNDIYQLTKQYFPVWKEELQILKPSIIIFLTGNYDWRIKEIVSEFDVIHIDTGRELFLDELKFQDVHIPRAYRTNHPRRLQMDKRYFTTANILTEIIKNHKSTN